MWSIVRPNIKSKDVVDLITLMTNKKLQRYTDPEHFTYQLVFPKYYDMMTSMDGYPFFLMSENNWLPAKDYFKYTSQFKFKPFNHLSPFLFGDFDSVAKAIRKIKPSYSREGSCFGGCACLYSADELKYILQLIGIPGFKSFSNKDQMCAAITFLTNSGILDMTFPFENVTDDKVTNNEGAPILKDKELEEIKKKANKEHPPKKPPEDPKENPKENPKGN